MCQRGSATMTKRNHLFAKRTGLNNGFPQCSCAKQLFSVT
jgi:hypothetical protein